MDLANYFPNGVDGYGSDTDSDSDSDYDSDPGGDHDTGNRTQRNDPLESVSNLCPENGDRSILNNATRNLSTLEMQIIDIFSHDPDNAMSAKDMAQMIFGIKATAKNVNPSLTNLLRLGLIDTVQQSHKLSPKYGLPDKLF